MLFLRRVLFYVFLLVYLIMCPLTILYALGYLFRPGSETRLIKTGLVYLSTAPPGATVFIGNKRYSNKTPAVLRDLVPGRYPVKLMLTGHESWAQTLPVEEEKATALERILLLPVNLKKEILLHDTYEDLLPLPDNPFFLLGRGPLLKDIAVFHWKDSRSWPIVPADSPYAGAKLLSHFSVRESPCLLLRAATEGGEKYLWFDLRAKQPEVEDVTHFFPKPPQRVEWNPRDRRHLYKFEDGNIHRYQTHAKLVQENYATGVRGFGFSGRWMYLLTNASIERWDEDRDKQVLFSDLAVLNQTFPLRTSFTIRPYERNLILFWGEHGELLSNRLPYHIAAEGVQGMEFFSGEDKLLVWQNTRLGVVDFHETKEDAVFERGPKLVWVYKQARKIEQAFWVFKGSYILYRDDDEIFLLELETYSKPNLRKLMKVRKKSSVFYSEETGKLYYLEAETGHLFSVEILPTREILPIPFPERKEETKPSEIQEL